MLTILGRPDRGSRFCDGLSRRAFLQVGGAAMGGLALNQLLSRRLLVPVLPEVLTADSVWRNELSKQTQLWYLRRRNLHYKAEVTSWSVAMKTEESVVEARVLERITGLNLKTRFNSLLNRATTNASAEVTSFLASPLLLKGSDATVRAAVTELEKAETVDSIVVMKVVERFSEPGFGEGLARLEESNEAFSGNTRVVENVTKSGLLPELDKLSRTLPEKEFKLLTDELVEVGSGNDADPIKPVLDCVVMSSAVHVYVSQSDRGEFVIGAGSDSHVSYSQRGSFDIIEGIMGALCELVPMVSRMKLMRQWGGIVDVTPDRSPIIGKTPVEGLFINCAWGTGGFKSTPGSGHAFAATLAAGEPNDMAGPFSLDRFRTGFLIDEAGAAAVAH